MRGGERRKDADHADDAVLGGNDRSRSPAAASASTRPAAASSSTRPASSRAFSLLAWWYVHSPVSALTCAAFLKFVIPCLPVTREFIATALGCPRTFCFESFQPGLGAILGFGLQWHRVPLLLPGTHAGSDPAVLRHRVCSTSVTRVFMRHRERTPKVHSIDQQRQVFIQGYIRPHKTNSEVL